MKLGIYTIEGVRYEGEAKSITVNTVQGEITVLEGHLPLVSVAKPGKMYYIDTRNERHFVEMPGGIIEVRPENEVVILSQSK